MHPHGRVTGPESIVVLSPSVSIMDDLPRDYAWPIWTMIFYHFSPCYLCIVIILIPKFLGFLWTENFSEFWIWKIFKLTSIVVILAMAMSPGKKTRIKWVKPNVKVNIMIVLFLKYFQALFAVCQEHLSPYHLKQRIRVEKKHKSWKENYFEFQTESMD